ncbi:MAG: amino acid ABC transporter permease [Acholeplasmatales bacterium]|nr:amino acid ABC transporter permease [Acholeplasmatales bacterium]
MKEWDIFVDYFTKQGGYRIILNGLLATAVIAVFGLIFGFLIGSLIAVVKVTPPYKKAVKIPQKICDLYVLIFRGTPMVVQLLIVHFVLFPILGVSFPNLRFTKYYFLQGEVFEAIIVFALNSGAYISEIMRGGINSVNIGQLEAGRALGLSYPKTMAKVVIPQAFRNVLPTLGNEFITLIKETSVVSFIAVIDLTNAFQMIAANKYIVIVPYLILGLVYLVLVMGISLLVRLLEKKLKRA